MDKVPIGKGDGSNAPSTVVHINPLDDNTDPTPFAFKPYDLAALMDIKTLKNLDTMGGLEGLCAGLGTNPTKGLSAHELAKTLVVKVPLPPPFPIVNEFTAPTRCRRALRSRWPSRTRFWYVNITVPITFTHSALGSAEYCCCSLLGPWHLSRCRLGAQTRGLYRRHAALRSSEC